MWLFWVAQHSSGNSTSRQWLRSTNRLFTQKTTNMKRFILTVAAVLGFGLSATLSAQTAQYISPDLFIEELRGNVAKVEYINEYGGIDSEKSYDEKGYLIPQDVVIERDAQTRIISITTSDDSDWYYAEKYIYDANGWLVNKEFEDDYATCVYTYFYDNTGTLVRTINNGENDDSEYQITINYLVMGRDHKGNWIKRRAQYTTVSDGETTYQETIIETRRITYR